MTHLFQTAVQHYQQGRLQLAESICQQILKQNPSHPEALHLLGLIAYQTGQWVIAEQWVTKALEIKPCALFHNHLGHVFKNQNQFALAVQHFQQALQLDPNHRDSLNHLSALLESQGQLEAAKACYQHLLRLEPQSAEIYGRLGHLLKCQNQLNAALECYQQVLRLQPDSAVAHNNRGNLFYLKNQFDEAIQCYQQALHFQPYYADAYRNMGTVFYAQNELTAALTCYQKFVQLEPHSAEGYKSLATILQAQDQLTAALTHCQKALHLKPDDAEIHNNMGTILQAQGELEQALIYYQQALHLNPKYTAVYNNIGTALQAQGRYDQALIYYQQTLRLKPNDAETYKNIGALFERQNQLETALKYYQHALQYQPNYVEAYYNYSLILLKMGQLIPGWSAYEWRFEAKVGHFSRLNKQLTKPKWDGSPLAGRRLLVHYEQGFGDTIQFIRYLPLITGGTLIFVCQPELQTLCQNLPEIDKLLVSHPDQDLPTDYDVWIYLLSLPYLFQTTLETIPTTVPYLYPDPNPQEKWHSRFKPDRLNIGIVWAGNPKHSHDHHRSCPLLHFKTIAQLPTVRLFSLQKGEVAHQPVPEGMVLISLTEELNDFADTAAALTGLDLVICVDTAVAHLSGALARPVWVLLPFAPDWRWLLKRQESLWYPTMRLFRQPQPGDWTSVFTHLVNQLSQF